MENEFLKVIINEEEQYSLWPIDKDIPLGWFEKYQGSKEKCLAFVKKNWRDMRPKSLRDK